MAGTMCFPPTMAHVCITFHLEKTTASNRPSFGNRHSLSKVSFKEMVLFQQDSSQRPMLDSSLPFHTLSSEVLSPDEKLGQKWAARIQKAGDHDPSQTSYQCFDPSVKSLGFFPCCQIQPSALLKTQGQPSARLVPLQVPLFSGLRDGLCVSVFIVVFAALYYGCVLPVSSYRLRGSLHPAFYVAN